MGYAHYLAQFLICEACPSCLLRRLTARILRHGPTTGA
ncbi:MAG: hypothetical protein OJF55_000668 [Rhodanobacteraceae bacterium]|nr:MAG: hypothetical protein OJF55_000668 [Rhodanobacteraceae bacterium]